MGTLMVLFSPSDSNTFFNISKDIYTEDQMVEENPEVVASITEGGDFKKPSEKTSKKTGDTEKKSEDKKVEEVESASGEKVVRAAHVPVPSQVCSIHFRVLFVNKDHFGQSRDYIRSGQIFSTE